MSYSDDFAGVDPGAPLDPTIMIGADPMLWGAIGLGLVVAGLVGWLIGQGGRSKRSDAAHAIWHAINDAAKAAMKADTEALPALASDLQRVLKARLGKTLAFGGELGKCVKALDKALKGEVEDTHGPAHGGPAPAPAAGQGHGDGEHGHDARPATAANVTISVHAPSAPAHPHPPEHGKRPMSTKERNDALRLAVADFNDYWRHRSAREGEMRAVVAELCNPGPPRPRLSHSGGHH